MKQSVLDLKELERKAYRSTYQDGIWDIYLGLIFLAFAFGPLVRNLGLSDGLTMVLHLVWVLLAGVFLWAGKRYITVPRLGLIKPGAERQRKIMNTRLVLLGSVIVGLILFVLLATDRDSIGSGMIALVFGINILVVLGLMAYFLSYERLYGYAALYALAMPLGMWLERNAGLPAAPYMFSLPAIYSLVVGLVLFTRFLKQYPTAPTGEMLNGSA